MLKKKSVFSALMCFAVTMCFSSALAETADKINWTEGYIEAVGEGSVKPTGNKAKDKMNARRAAEVKAQRALLEKIKGVRVTSTTTVKDAMASEDVIKTGVEGFVQGAQIVSEKVDWESDGSAIATVTLRACIMDGASCKGGLSLVRALTPDTTPDAPTEAKEDTGQDQARQDTVADVVVPTALPRPAAINCDLSKSVTGVVFTLEGKPFERVLMPVIISEGAKDEPERVYSAKLVKPSIFRSFGAVRYADSVEAAVKQSHVCGNVLVLPVKEITRENLIVISSRDVSTIKETLAHGNNYLEDAKVVISAK